MFAVFFGLLVAALQISGAPSHILRNDDFTDLKSHNLHDHGAFHRKFHRSRYSPLLKNPYYWPSYNRLRRFPILNNFDYHVIPSRWVNEAGDSNKNVLTGIPLDNTISPIPGSDSTKSKQHQQNPAHQRTRSSIEERNVPFRKRNSYLTVTGTNDLRLIVADKSSVGQEPVKDNSVVLPAEDVQTTKDYGGSVSMSDVIRALDDTQKKSVILNTSGDTVKDNALEVKESEDTDMDKGSAVINVSNDTYEETSNTSTITQEKSGSPDINDKSEETTAKVVTTDNSDVDKVTTWHTTMDETSSKFPTAEETGGTKTSEIVTSKNSVADDKTSEIATTEKEKRETTPDLPIDNKSKKTSIEDDPSTDTPSSPATEASQGTSEVTAKKEASFSSTVSKATSVLDEENTSPDTKVSHSDDALLIVSSSVPTTDIASSSSKVLSGSTAPSNVDNISNSPTATQLKASTAKSIAEEATEVHERDIIIPSFKTARIVVTSIFLAIGLTALAVLAVYIFKQKRKAVQYDQLTLLP